ncbi:MAG TPA: pyridoxamine 5'-phosphate oxidase family protein [Candidatus Aquicultoraceae bacterium]|nr:pyridoxamine 5'-phosphate oxidase family protein [Candidatus Aquicultoraceae bacterium]
MNRSGKGGEMAKTVSDTLVVRIVQKGEEKVFDLRKTFNENPNRVISTVGTVDEDGWPNTAPMSLLYCPDERTIIAGMVKASRTAGNLRRNGRVMIEMVFGGDVVFGIRGKGTVLKEALECSEATMAFQIEVVSVKRDTSPAQIVTSGASCTPRSERAAEYEKAAWKELMGLAST